MDKERLPIGTVFIASRLKAAILMLCSLAFVALGLFLINRPGASPQIAGWLSILFGGGYFLLWLGAIALPTRLIITNSGFSVQQLLFPERKYAWKKIDKLWAMQRRIAPMVVWTYKERPELLAAANAAIGQTIDYDGALPPVWRISADDLAAQLNAQRTPNLRSSV